MEKLNGSAILKRSFQEFLQSLVAAPWTHLEELDHLTPEKREVFQHLLQRLIFHKDHTEIIISLASQIFSGSSRVFQNLTASPVVYRNPKKAGSQEELLEIDTGRQQKVQRVLVKMTEPYDAERNYHGKDLIPSGPVFCL